MPDFPIDPELLIRASPPIALRRTTEAWAPSASDFLRNAVTRAWRRSFITCCPCDRAVYVQARTGVYTPLTAPRQFDILQSGLAGEFISLVGGAAAWPLAARAQQGERVRTVGILASQPLPPIQGPLDAGINQRGVTRRSVSAAERSSPYRCVTLFAVRRVVRGRSASGFGVVGRTTRQLCRTAGDAAISTPSCHICVYVEHCGQSVKRPRLAEPSCPSRRAVCSRRADCT
jgi:hypothetical protein